MSPRDVIENLTLISNYKLSATHIWCTSGKVGHLIYFLHFSRRTSERRRESRVINSNENHFATQRWHTLLKVKRNKFIVRFSTTQCPPTSSKVETSTKRFNIPRRGRTGVAESEHYPRRTYLQRREKSCLFQLRIHSQTHNSFANSHLRKKGRKFERGEKSRRRCRPRRCTAHCRRHRSLLSSWCRFFFFEFMCICKYIFL